MAETFPHILNPYHWGRQTSIKNNKFDIFSIIITIFNILVLVTRMFGGAVPTEASSCGIPWSWSYKRL